MITNVEANVTSVNNAVTTANINMKGYVDAANTIQSNQITAVSNSVIGANAAIVTANINMKGYVDSVANLSSYSDANVTAYLPTHSGTISASGIELTNGNLNIINNDGNIYIGDITAGTVSTDVGVIFDGRQLIKSGIFTEVNGNILSYAINMGQITSNISAIAGGIFRLDVRDAHRKFVVVRRAAGETSEEETFDISLDTGLARFTSNLQVGRTPTDYSNLTVTHSTPSISTTTGALQVAGGVGIAGNLHAGNVTATTFIGALTGNATTATTLQTARTIGGVSFDGSTNINLPGVNITGNQNTTGSAATLTTARTINGVSFNGSTNIVITANTTATLTRGTGLTGGNFNGSTATTFAVSYGTTSGTACQGNDSRLSDARQATNTNTQLASLGVGTAASGTTGEIRATNNITAFYSSDARLKENVREIPDALSKVSAIGGKLFDWTDDYIISHGGEDAYFLPKESFGFIAQDVEKVFPEAVRTREDGYLAVDYEKMCVLAFQAIKELQQQVQQLEQQIKGK